MACMVVPAAEAVVLTAVQLVIRHKEKKAALRPALGEQPAQQKTGFSRKLGWLTAMLWGGAFLLAFEHLWHGEIVPWFPFLTAMADPVEKAAMLHEMATVGVTMAVLVTAVWGLMVLATSVMEKRARKAQTTEG